jgi:hypothetical protein
MFDRGSRDEARSLCEQCPAVQVCLWATMLEEGPGRRFGFAGGMTAGQRSALARRVSPAVVVAAHSAALAAWDVIHAGAREAEESGTDRPRAAQVDERRDGPAQDPVSAAVIALVASAYGMEPAQLCGRSRTRHVVDARQIAMYVLREAVGYSFPAVGAVFGRDHTTAMSAVARVRARLAERPALRRGIQGLLDRLNGDAAGADVGSVPRATIATEPSEGSAVSSDPVLDVVARVSGVPVGDLLGAGRTRHVSAARQVAMYALREVRGFSYPAIGQALGGRDHTTAMHGIERVRRAVAESQPLGKQALHVIASLRAAEECEAA